MTSPRSPLGICDDIEQITCDDCLSLLSRLCPSSGRFEPCEIAKERRCPLRCQESYLLDGLGRDWCGLLDDMKETRRFISDSWLFNSFSHNLNKQMTDAELRRFLTDTMEEARRIKAYRQLSVEVARTGRVRMMTVKKRRVDLTEIVGENLGDVLIEDLPPLPTVHSDPYRWSIIVREIYEGGSILFGPLQAVSCSDDRLTFQFVNTSGFNPTTEISICSEHGVEIYRAFRIASWDDCALAVNADGSITIDLSCIIRVRPLEIPEECEECVERFSTLERIYRQMLERSSVDISGDCVAERVLLPMMRMRRFLSRQWEWLFRSFERTGWDTCEPLNGVVRLCSMILDAEQPIEQDDVDELSHLIEIFCGEWRLLNTMGTEVVLNAPFCTVMEHDHFTFEEVIEDVKKELQPLLQERGAVIEVMGEFPRLFGRKDRWGMALREMVCNSVHYNENETPIIRLFPFADRILIRDNGVGIPIEKWEVIFDVFTTLRAGRYSDLELQEGSVGYGMGLFFAKVALQWEGGDLRVASSEEDLGTTFEMILPH